MAKKRKTVKKRTVKRKSSKKRTCKTKSLDMNRGGLYILAIVACVAVVCMFSVLNVGCTTDLSGQAYTGVAPHNLDLDLSEYPTDVDVCIESDDGDDPSDKGYVAGRVANDLEEYNYDDFCMGNNGFEEYCEDCTLFEYYCEDGNLAWNLYNGVDCMDGRLN